MYVSLVQSRDGGDGVVKNESVGKVVMTGCKMNIGENEEDG